MDDQIEVKIDGTSLTYEAGSGDAFERSAVYSEPNGVPTVTVEAFDASDPVRLWTWVTWHNAVFSLIAVNYTSINDPAALVSIYGRSGF